MNDNLRPVALLRPIANPSSEAIEAPERLVARLRAREPAAAIEAFRAFGAIVVRYLRRHLGPDQDVEDLVQEVFLRFFSSIEQLREPSAVRSFLIGITLHVIRKHRSSRWSRRWLFLSATGALPDVGADDGSIESRAALKQFYALLAQLDSESAMVFVLQRIEELELRDIASAMRLSLATVKRRLAHAEDRLAVLVARDPILKTYLQTHKKKGREHDDAS